LTNVERGYMLASRTLTEENTEMRRGSQEVGVITSPVEPKKNGKCDGQVIGLSLGWDCVSEHEWGISNILNAFGVPSEPRRGLVGADVRTITKTPDCFRFFDNLNSRAYLMYTDAFRWENPDVLTAKYFDNILRVRDEEDLSAAWDSKSFGVRMKNDVLNLGTTVLGQIYEAFTKLDAMIFLGGRALFGNRGLVLAIRSRMPDDILQKMKISDEDYFDLMDAAEKTGVKQKLRTAGKRYYALSPRWTKNTKFTENAENGARQTKCPVVFWLNPEDQRNNNSGWFTFEQLLEWIDNKGPIPKKVA